MDNTTTRETLRWDDNDPRLAPTPRTDAVKDGEVRLRTFKVTIPTTDGKKVLRRVSVKNVPMRWDANIGEWVLETEGLRMIEIVKADRMIKDLRSELASRDTELAALRKDRERLVRLLDLAMNCMKHSDNCYVDHENRCICGLPDIEQEIVEALAAMETEASE